MPNGVPSCLVINCKESSNILCKSGLKIVLFITVLILVRLMPSCFHQLRLTGLYRINYLGCTLFIPPVTNLSITHQMSFKLIDTSPGTSKSNMWDERKREYNFTLEYRILYNNYSNPDIRIMNLKNLLIPYLFMIISIKLETPLLTHRFLPFPHSTTYE